MAKKLDSISPIKKTPSPPTEVISPVQNPPEATIPAPEPTTDKYETLFPEPTVSISHPPVIVLWLILLIVSGVVGVIGFKIANKKVDSWLAVTASPTTTSKFTPIITSLPTQNTVITPTPTATPSLAPTASASPSPVSTATPVVLQKKDITIRIANGTTEPGAASTAKSVLEKAGFTIRLISNAKQQNYPSTIIYYQPGKQAEAELVKKSLSGYITSLQESNLSYPDMVLVVLGKQ